MDALAGDDEGPEQWSTGGWKELETLEEALHCPICGELFDTPVSVSECGHVFCSVCLRRHLEYQQRSNRALDNSATCPQVRQLKHTHRVGPFFERIKETNRLFFRFVGKMDTLSILVPWSSFNQDDQTADELEHYRRLVQTSQAEATSTTDLSKRRFCDSLAVAT